LHVCLFRLLIDPGNGGIRFFWNVGTYLPDYTM
jgi:hypothetical protein